METEQSNITVWSSQCRLVILQIGRILSITFTNSNLAAYAVKMKRDIAKRQSIVKLDGPKKRQRQYNIFEAIKKTQVKREQAQKPNCEYLLGL